jgi:Serine carboxypeptidase
VGFSFCEKGVNCTNTDESTADDTADFLKTFYKEYPEFAEQDLLITGESYAGVMGPTCACLLSDVHISRLVPASHLCCPRRSGLTPSRRARAAQRGGLRAGVYLPMLAERLLQQQPAVPLRGMAVGNGCWGTAVGICSGNGESMEIATQFFHGHVMFDDALWDAMREHCDWSKISKVRALWDAFAPVGACEHALAVEILCCCWRPRRVLGATIR